MKVRFLGTGAAWSLPEHSCRCAICAEMRERGETRTRTSLEIIAQDHVLVDCGPDLLTHMKTYDMARPDVVLITHEHGDHFIGMDDLLAFRRCRSREDWSPIPVYATEQAWKAIEVRFGYLIGSTVEKRIAEPGVPLQGTTLRITPFKTNHGPSAPGSVGYVFEEAPGSGAGTLVYTSDFLEISCDASVLQQPKVLVIQSQWLNEPLENRPYHMSFQRALEFIREWNPLDCVYLVHVSDGDQVPGDPCNGYLKKYPPRSPMADPVNGIPYAIPRCASEWQTTVDRIRSDYGISVPIVVASDGMVVPV